MVMPVSSPLPLDWKSSQAKEMDVPIRPFLAKSATWGVSSFRLQGKAEAGEISAQAMIATSNGAAARRRE